MGTGVENAIQQKLGIKYVDARRLVQEAQQSLGIPAGHQQPVAAECQVHVVEEAIDIFEELTPEEQAEMLQPVLLEQGEPAAEADWTRRAREQAEKREREWEQEAAGATATAPADPNAERAVASTESSEDDPELEEEDEDPYSTRSSVTKTRTKTKTRVVTPSSSTRRRGFDRSGDPLHEFQAANVYHKTVVCVIL
jgi:hypothetical protein